MKTKRPNQPRRPSANRYPALPYRPPQAVREVIDKIVRQAIQKAGYPIPMSDALNQHFMEWDRREREQEK